MKKIIISTVVLGVLLISGCVKDATVTIVPTVTKTVSFKKDLLPLFVKNCATGGCHSEGAKAPILTEKKAYESLKADPEFINLAKPEESEIYLFLTGKKSPAMPMGAASNPGNINAYFLAWVKQGAKNN